MKLVLSLKGNRLLDLPSWLPYSIKPLPGESRMNLASAAALSSFYDSAPISSAVNAGLGALGIGFRLDCSCRLGTNA